MSTKKLYDLKVKTGEYTSNGETKGRYETVGAVMQKDDGNKFLMLKRTFNPAGVPNPDQRDTVLVSMFKPDDDKPQRRPQQRTQQDKPAPAAGDFADDDIPF